MCAHETEPHVLRSQANGLASVRLWREQNFQHTRTPRRIEHFDYQTDVYVSTESIEASPHTPTNWECLIAFFDQTNYPFRWSGDIASFSCANHLREFETFKVKYRLAS